MALLPARRAVAFTVMEAVPAVLRAAVPSVLVPRLKVSVPAGAVVPLAAFTVAESRALPVLVIDAGLAERLVVVPMSGTVTVTTAGAAALAKLPEAV
jgi:hypothetical protein